MAILATGLAAAFTTACGDTTSPPPTPPAPTYLEVTIARDLSVKLGHAVTVACPIPMRCFARVTDLEFPVEVARTTTGWVWKVARLIVRVAPIEGYLAQVLRDLGAAQAIHCGPEVQLLEPESLVECGLEHGGKAFASIHADGTFTTEIELDPVAAAARSKAGSIDDHVAGDTDDTADDD